MIAQIVGYIGNDAEAKESNGRTYVKFSVADTFKAKGEETTVWVTCFTNMTGLVPYLKKGKQVFVTGELLPSVRENKLDVTMNVHSLKFCGKKDEQQTEG